MVHQSHKLLPHHTHGYVDPFPNDFFQPTLQYELDGYVHLESKILKSYEQFHDEWGRNLIRQRLLAYHL
ncbi:hypothetical protein SAM_0318 [Streptococcus agalactiae CJB111]|nr:hypothetical protein SAM_0318 [Streptococcus agalactiae CJB111]